MLNTWQFNLILFYIFIVIYFQFYKLSVKNVKNDGAATILIQTIAGVSILALAPLFPFTIPNKLSVLLLLVGACVFYAVTDRLQMTARKHLEVSAFSVISQLSTVFVILYGLTVFNEPFSLVRIGGAALIIAANAMIFYRPGKHSIVINKYSVMAILATVSFATAISIDINIVKNFNLPVYISLTLLIPALLIAIGGRTTPKDSVAELKRGNPVLFVITGLAWSLAIFFSLRAYQFGKVNSIVTLQAVGVILNVLAAYIFLKERDHPVQKILAACLVIVGVLLTTL